MEETQRLADENQRAARLWYNLVGGIRGVYAAGNRVHLVPDVVVDTDSNGNDETANATDAQNELEDDFNQLEENYHEQEREENQEANE